jgi:hypothetical protein
MFEDRKHLTMADTASLALDDRTSVSWLPLFAFLASRG